MEKGLRNTLRNVVTDCRRELEKAIGELLQGQFGIHVDGTIESAEKLTHLSQADQDYRAQVVAWLEHIKAGGFIPAGAVGQLIREVAFTHLNRLCAYKLLEKRRLIRETISRGLKSNGFKFTWPITQRMRRSGPAASKTWPIGIFWSGLGPRSLRRLASSSPPTTRPTASFHPSAWWRSCWD